MSITKTWVMKMRKLYIRCPICVLYRFDALSASALCAIAKILFSALQCVHFTSVRHSLTFTLPTVCRPSTSSARQGHIDRSYMLSSAPRCRPTMISDRCNTLSLTPMRPHTLRIATIVWTGTRRRRRTTPQAMSTPSTTNTQHNMICIPSILRI